MRRGEAASGPWTASLLLERADQMAALEGSMATVRDARDGRLVLIRGEAGAGKTAVVRAFCEQPGAPIRVLWGACEALFTPRALAPFVDIAEVTGGEFATLVHGAAQPHEVLGALTREVATRRPTALVLEDIHWADEATLDVLRLLGRRIAAFEGLVIATYREDEVDGSRELRMVLGELARASGVESLRVPRLSPRAVAELAEPTKVNPVELYRRTGGNAFFVTEVLAAGTHEIPSTVRDAVLARAAGLSRRSGSLLEAVAIAQPADLSVIGLIAADAVEDLDECIDCGMLVPNATGVAFRHELARQVIEEAIPPTRKKALHALALDALAGSSDYAWLAHHAEAAGNVEEVLRFAPQAAKQASSLGAHREGAAQCARALRFANRLPPVERAELLEQQALDCMLTDQIDEAIDVTRVALAVRAAVGDARAQSRTLLMLSNVLWCPGHVAESFAAAREAARVLDGLEPGSELALAFARLSQLSMDAEDLEESVAWGTRALELATALDHTEIYIHALISVSAARCLAGDPAGRDELERSRALAVDAGLEEQIGRADLNLVWVTRRQREYALAYEYLEPALRYASERGAELWRGYQLGYRARMELDLGHWQEAVDTAGIILREPGRSRVPQIEALSVIGRLRARRADPDVWAPLDEALLLAGRSEELQAAEPVAAARAEAAWLEGDADGVERATAEALRLARRRRSRWVWSELAAWRKRAGIDDQLDPDEAMGPYALELANDWTGAAAAWRRLGFPYEAALALSETSDSQDLLQALDELRAMTATRAEAIVIHRLRQRGVRGVPRGPRASTHENPAGLTARELDVLALLAEGLRNAQIAARLVVSERTVDHHVSAILQKLDVSTRGEAAAEARRRQLLAPR